MIPRYICVLFCIICHGDLFSQVTLTGKVINAETKQTLSGTSVYLSNTSFGDSTNDKGIFTLTGIRHGSYKLVVSYTGFETFVMQVTTNTGPQQLLIELKPKTEELSEIVLQPYETNGWDKWGQFFIDNFIGSTPYAKDCFLENYTALRFRFNKKLNTLFAYAKQPLVIKNYSLGYKISYSLQEFEFDFSSQTLSYSGYPLFIDMSKELPGRARSWRKKRAETYNGSLMHFMRSFSFNRLTEEQFEMRSLDTVDNAAKARAKYLFGLRKDTTIERMIDTIWKFTVDGFRRNVKTEDSTAYYKRALTQPDRIVSHALVARDSVGTDIDSITTKFYTPSPLEVISLSGLFPMEYKRVFPEHRFEKSPVSQLTFINKTPIAILNNGAYSGPHDLRITGFWSWWETIATMLPYDYVPPLNYK